MSVPKFPTLFISPVDRDRLSLDKTPTIAETLFGDVTHSTDFINNFTITSSSLSKTSNLKQITMTVQKINGDGLLNTTFSVGTIPVAFRPANNVSGTFPYGTFISDTGQIRVNSDGTVSIRTGDSSYIGDGSTVTITLLYI